MTEHQRLFLVQARSDFIVFELLRERSDLPACHALHYLQMATEMIAKAFAWRGGRPAQMSHKAFVNFLRSLSTNRRAQQQLGYAEQNENWTHLIKKSLPLAKRVEDLAPALNPDGPNPEYPWPRDAPESAPAEHDFEIWQALQGKAEGRQFLKLVSDLFAVADALL